MRSAFEDFRERSQVGTSGGRARLAVIRLATRLGAASLTIFLVSAAISATSPQRCFAFKAAKLPSKATIRTNLHDKKDKINDRIEGPFNKLAEEEQVKAAADAVGKAIRYFPESRFAFTLLLALHGTLVGHPGEPVGIGTLAYLLNDVMQNEPTKLMLLQAIGGLIGSRAIIFINERLLLDKDEKPEKGFVVNRLLSDPIMRPFHHFERYREKAMLEKMSPLERALYNNKAAKWLRLDKLLTHEKVLPIADDVVATMQPAFAKASAKVGPPARRAARTTKKVLDPLMDTIENVVTKRITQYLFPMLPELTFAGTSLYALRSYLLEPQPQVPAVGDNGFSGIATVIGTSFIGYLSTRLPIVLNRSEKKTEAKQNQAKP